MANDGVDSRGGTSGPVGGDSTAELPYNMLCLSQASVSTLTRSLVSPTLDVMSLTPASSGKFWPGEEPTLLA